LLLLRNHFFQRLVEAHGYTAIAIESSYPRGRSVNEFVLGSGADAYDQIAQLGFSHGFGNLAGSRQLVEWMRAYNADPSHRIALQFYGFDSPTEMSGAESPGQLLSFALTYLRKIDPLSAEQHRSRIDPLLDQPWETPGATFDPGRSVGSS